MEDKKPDITEQDDTYVIDDTGDLQEVAPKLIDEALGEKRTPAPATSSAEVQKLRDQLLRSRADFENFRKRSEREKAEYFKYALTGAMRDLLPVLDNLERAIAHADDPGEDFLKGIELIYKQFLDQLQNLGVRTIGEVSEPFDPNMHEAVMREEKAGVPPNTVTDVFQKGYMLHDRLLRPAMVKVAVGNKQEDKS